MYRENPTEKKKWGYKCIKKSNWKKVGVKIYKEKPIEKKNDPKWKKKSDILLYFWFVFKYTLFVEVTSHFGGGGKILKVEQRICMFTPWASWGNLFHGVAFH